MESFSFVRKISSKPYIFTASPRQPLLTILQAAPGRTGRKSTKGKESAARTVKAKARFPSLCVQDNTPRLQVSKRSILQRALQRPRQRAKSTRKKSQRMMCGRYGRIAEDDFFSSAFARFASVTTQNTFILVCFVPQSRVHDPGRISPPHGTRKLRWARPLSIFWSSGAPAFRRAEVGQDCLPACPISPARSPGFAMPAERSAFFAQPVCGRLGEWPGGHGMWW
ncbi:hypothetical protein B0T09DRAFT_166518 [Sordaria sp. MPI-SDFR-AT-0083]|nr:hypothetical protein B0T09DRAFT_166518 [Sordaria sp. MPI-SDFR-AT-0083]